MKDSEIAYIYTIFIIFDTKLWKYGCLFRYYFYISDNESKIDRSVIKSNSETILKKD